MKRRLLVISSLVLVTALLAFLPSYAQNNTWALVSRKAGLVESRLNNSQTWLRITSNRRLGNHDFARTGQDGAANVHLADNSILAMGPNTTAKMQTFALNARHRNVKVVVPNGMVRAQVSKFRGRNNRFQISTPNAVIAAQGTDFLVEVQQIVEGTAPSNSGNTDSDAALIQNAELFRSSHFATLVTVKSGQVGVTVFDENNQPHQVTINAGNTRLIVSNTSDYNNIDNRGDIEEVSHRGTIVDELPGGFETMQSGVYDWLKVNGIVDGGDAHLQAPIRNIERGSTSQATQIHTTGFDNPKNRPEGTADSAADGANSPVQISPTSLPGSQTGSVIIDINGVR